MQPSPAAAPSNVLARAGMSEENNDVPVLSFNPAADFPIPLPPSLLPKTLSALPAQMIRLLSDLPPESSVVLIARTERF